VKRLQLSRRDRRALVGGAAAIALVLGVVRAVPAARSWDREARAESGELRAALARDRAMIARSATVRESTIARGRRIIALAPSLLGGETVAGAAASLASLLSGAAAQSNVRLGAVQLRGDSLSHSAFTRIGAHVDATGDVTGISHLLSALERGSAVIAIKSFAITQPDVAAGDDRVEALHLEMDVEGIMLNPKRSK